MSDIHYKECSKCGESKPLDHIHYRAVRNGKSFRGECRACEAKVSAGRLSELKQNDPFKLMIETRYATYKSVDKSKGFEEPDISFDYLAKALKEPCIYCGHYHDLKMGLDRIDNDLGHTIDNTVVACSMCNVARNNHFSFDDMLTVGLAHAKVFSSRILNELIATINTIQVVSDTIEIEGYIIWN